MRISDWSSDVCSSDLHIGRRRCRTRGIPHGRADHRASRGITPIVVVPIVIVVVVMVVIIPVVGNVLGSVGAVFRPLTDRKSVVEGKSVSVRVDLGGRRRINKKKTNIDKAATSL